MNENTYCQWVVDGLGGVVNMVEALVKHKVKMTTAAQEKLADYAKRLGKAAESQDKQKSDG